MATERDPLVREQGDDVVIQLRVRRANLPVLTGPDGVPCSGIALRRRADGVYELESVSSFFEAAVAGSVLGVDQVSIEKIDPQEDGEHDAG